MFRGSIIGAVFFIGLGAALAEDAPKRKAEGWVKSWGEARTLARSSGKPIFAVIRCER